jgi:GTP-binding protein
MAFVDECVVLVKGGRGGDGSASFHRQPYEPKGAPDGGNGGPGGDVVFEVSPRLHDLSWLADHPHQRAGDGGAGRSSNRYGAAGRDRVVEVPDGTAVFEGEELVADLVGDGLRTVIARGGRGGRGNAAFAGPRNRTPRTAESGEPGEERRVRVELRIVADVGLVGLPNAGKSMLLSKLTAARPKVAAYPFTTLSPNLGVAGNGERFVVADVPGLVEGASEGRGLGHRFLRHIVRCPALVLTVDLAAEDAAGDLAALRGELAAYDPNLAVRPSVVVGTKADLVDDPPGRARRLDPGAVAVSSLTGAGLDDLSVRLSALVRTARPLRREPTPHVVIRPGRPPFTVKKEGELFRVEGRSVERWVRETDLDDPRQVSALQRRLVKEGVEKKLAEAGAHRGDEVMIAGHVFEFIPE